jgi:hypothetical protein
VVERPAMGRRLRSTVMFALAACTPHVHASADAGAADALSGATALDAASDGGQGDLDGSTPDDALPASTSDDLTTRARHLLEAITSDDPNLATDIVFPRDAYIASKDAADPGKQWDSKVSGAYSRAVHTLHKRVKGIERAQFISFEIGQPVSQTVPKKRDMSRPLWHVKQSRIVFAVDSKATHVDIAEMMSWRGAWYVLKLR